MTQQQNYIRRAEQGATLSLVLLRRRTNTSNIIEHWCNRDRIAVHDNFVTEMGGHPSDGPSIEAIVTAYQEHYYPSPIYKLVDAYDIYLCVRWLHRWR